MKTKQMHSSYKINTDPIDYDSLVEMAKCLFCGPPQKEILTETEHMYVTFDVNPLREGHIDIHTKDHIGCSAEIDPELYEEFLSLKQWTAKLLSKIYGDVSFYEHGRAGHCGLTVDGVICHHFHMHALPLSIDISSEVSKSFRPILLENEKEIPELYQQYDQYLYFENSKGQKFFFPVNKPLPSHYLRTVIANAIGKPERADWENCFDGNMVNNFKRLLAQLEA